MSEFIYIKYYKRMPLPESEDLELKDSTEPFHHLVHGSGRWDVNGEYSFLPLIKMENCNFLTEGYLKKDDISFFSINYHFLENNIYFFVVHTKNNELYVCDSNNNNYDSFYKEMLGIKEDKKEPIIKPIDFTL